MRYDPFTSYTDLTHMSKVTAVTAVTDLTHMSKVTGIQPIIAIATRRFVTNMSYVTQAIHSQTTALFFFY